MKYLLVLSFFLLFVAIQAKGQGGNKRLLSGATDPISDVAISALNQASQAIGNLINVLIGVLSDPGAALSLAVTTLITLIISVLTVVNFVVSALLNGLL